MTAVTSHTLPRQADAADAGGAPAVIRLSVKAAKLLVVAGFLVACADADGEIRIGAAGPWNTGYGSMNRMGIELAEAEINAAGGIGGRPLTIVYADDAGDGARAATIAQEFVDTPSMLAVIGHVNSGAMVAAAKIYHAGELPAVATTATAPELTGISPWVFRVISSDSVNGVDLGRFASHLGHQRAAILYENNSYGRGLADSFRRAFGGEIVAMDPINEGDADVEPYITWYHRLAPDIVFVAGTELSGMAVLREARRRGLRADFLGGDGWTGVVAEPAAEGAYVGAPFSALEPRKEVREFVERFRSRYGREPDGNAALAYDATMLVARAAERARTREDIRDLLASGDLDFAGVTGPIRFRRDGDPVGRSFVMTRVRGRRLVVEDGQ